MSLQSIGHVMTRHGRLVRLFVAFALLVPFAPVSATSTSDNFDDNSLDTNIWTVDNPVGSVAETGNKLAITVPSASAGDWWVTPVAAPVVSTPLLSGDLDITVKLDTGNFINGTHAGIAIWTDRDNFYLFGRRRNGIGTKNGLTLDKVVNNASDGDICDNSVTTLPVYLKVIRTGSAYDFRYSTNGTSWTSFCTQSSLGFTPDKAGLFFKKWQTGAGDITVTFDDFVMQTVDSEVPSVSFTAPTDGATVTSTIALQADATDNVAVTSVRFLIGSTVLTTDTSSPYGVSLDTTAYANGTSTLSAVATDTSGNAATTTINVFINNPDITAPSVAFTAPASGATIGGSISVQADASDNIGVSSVRFLIEEDEIGVDSSAPYSVTLDTTLYADGPYTLFAVATDAAGNAATTTRNVTITAPDTTAPSVSVTAPTDGATVTSTISVQADASDNIGVASVQFLIDGTFIATVTSSPYATNLNTTVYANGTSTLSAVAMDASGNAATSTISVFINNPDVTAPSVSFTSPADGAAVTSTIAVQADASDNIGVSSVRFLIGETEIGVDSSAPYAANFDPTGYTEGLHTLVAVATDAAGNAATTTRNIYITTPDVTAPSVWFFAPKASASLTGTVTAQAFAVDNVSVSSVQFLIDSTSIAVDVAEPYTAAFNVASYAAGTHVLTAIATDIFGNTSSTSRTVTFQGSIKIVVLGASTAAGKNLVEAGFSLSESWVNEYAALLATEHPGSTVTNLAVSGFTTYQILPTGTNNGGNPAVSSTRNITTAIASNPDAIIVAMPSITYSNDVIMANLAIIHATATAAGIPVWVATSQPQFGDSSSTVATRLDLRNRLITAYGSFVLDFHTPFASSVDGSGLRDVILTYDDVHPTPLGHDLLLEQVRAADIYGVVAP